MAQQVEYDGLTKLVQNLKATIPALAISRKKIHEEIGQQLLTDVRDNISDVRKLQLGRRTAQQSTGRVKSWQEAYTGSLGGYAAVRAKANTFHGAYAVGAITNAVDSGHKKPGPNAGRVDGLGFYAASRARAQSIAQTYAQTLADQVAAELERIS